MCIRDRLNGDFNFDGASDCLDLALIYDRTATNNNHLTFDLNGDGVVTASDAITWIEERGFSAGDANLDGVVTPLDLEIVQENLFTETHNWCQGDFTADGFVDGSDFNVWNNAAQASVTAVPEPGGIGLLGGAALFALSVGRGRRAVPPQVSLR